jgi:Superfamily I DNA and RNA helicases
MSSIRLIQAAAGSGKTELIVREALSDPNHPSLLTTFTQANEKSIRQRIMSLMRYIPEHVTVQTWDSFLLQHAIRPYQGCVSDSFRSVLINGMLWVESQSSQYKSEERAPLEHYFHNSNGNCRVYSDKIAKLAVRCGEKSNNASISRIAKLFKRIYIDECQDLAGYDLDFLLMLGAYTSELILVGDPRQVTYLTHWERRNQKYRNGGIKHFLCDNRVAFAFDDKSLRKSHRNHKAICEYAARLYPSDIPGIPCDCCKHDDGEYQGIFCISPEQLSEYAKKYNVTQLRMDKRTRVMEHVPAINFGLSKGMTFDRAIIYPTKKIKDWILNNSITLPDQTRAKFYVAITRARYSVAFVLDESIGNPPELIRYQMV